MITINTNDWTAVYINEKLEYEGHSIPTEIMFELVKKDKDFNYQSIYISEETQEELELWDFPKKLAELPSEVLKELEL